MCNHRIVRKGDDRIMGETVDIQKIIGNIDKLPTLPYVVTALNDFIKNPNTSAADIRKIIMKDQALSSHILKLVNSAFYGFSERISSISHAIVILGFNTVKNVALTASVFRMFPKDNIGDTQFDVKGFWVHSLAVASTARLIAARAKIPGIEDIFVAGLLHDIGKVILEQFVHDKFIEILMVTKKKNILMREAEAEVLDGVTHSQIGAWLATRWKLPTGLVHMIGFHHRPELDEQLLKPVACIHLADILVRCFDYGSGGDKKMPKINQMAWESLGFTFSDIEDIMIAMDSELSEAEAFLSEV